MMNGVKIKSINGAEVLKLKEGKDAEFGKAVFSNSLLLDKLKELGLDINKQNSTKDIISVKFDYGYTSQEALEMVEEYKAIKNNNKSIKKDNKVEINRIKQLNKIIEKAKFELSAYKNEIDLLKCEKEINKLNKKITTRENKLLKCEKELSEIDTKCLEQLDSNINKMQELENDINDNTFKKDVLRDLLYEEGFEIDTYKTVKKERKFDKTIRYKYWFRTGGKAKNGEDYFINEELWDKINQWQSMGIKLPATNAKLVEYEVYKSLVSSAIEDYIVIKPSEILVVSDLDCYSELQDVIKVVRNEESDKKESIAIHTKARCKNTIWDGMCLIQGGEGFRGLRHHFYKTGAFCGDFQQYFKDEYKDDYENAEVTDRYGRKVKVSTIKMITTENAMKWEKFLGASKESFEFWAKCVEENGCKFGICKRNHKSKYGSKQRMSYQMLNTLPYIDVEELFKDSKKYIYKMKNDDKFFIEHLKRTASEVNNNKLLADIASTYKTFVNSYYFKDNRKAEINKYKEQLQKGKLLIEGDNETILANPILLLDYCMGRLDSFIENGGVISGYIDETLPNKNSCYCKRFKEETIGAFRSPHNSPSNILVFENHIDKKMDKYFSSFGDNVIAVNMLYNDVQARGNGLDEDTDFLLCTNDFNVIESCKKAQKYPTIINGFKPSPKTYNNTMSDLSKIDNMLQNSQNATGTSSNVAMQYLSQYWDMKNKQEKEREKKEMEDYNYYFIDKVEEDEESDRLLDNACILSILAQVSVDASKRAYEVGKDENGLNSEIDRLRKELPSNLKPTFWQYTSSAFKTEEIKKKLKNKDKKAWNSLNEKEQKLSIKNEKKRMIEELYDYNCPFNLILKEIDKVKRADSNNRISDENFLVLWGDSISQDGKQAKKIEDHIKNFDSITKFINTNDDLEDDDNMHYYNVLYREYLDKILNLTIKLDTMSLMIIRALDKENKYLKSNKKIRTKLLNILYKYSCKRVEEGKEKENIFLNCFRDYINTPDK
ncbi:hypothetical protein FDB42_13670 [Clostridium botulinum]|nr:hypothetical protein [Clostridium botulinum]